MSNIKNNEGTSAPNKAEEKALAIEQARQIKAIDVALTAKLPDGCQVIAESKFTSDASGDDRKALCFATCTDEEWEGMTERERLVIPKLAKYVLQHLVQNKFKNGVVGAYGTTLTHVVYGLPKPATKTALAYVEEVFGHVGKLSYEEAVKALAKGVAKFGIATVTEDDWSDEASIRKYLLGAYTAKQTYLLRESSAGIL